MRHPSLLYAFHIDILEGTRLDRMVFYATVDDDDEEEEEMDYLHQ